MGVVEVEPEEGVDQAGDQREAPADQEDEKERPEGRKKEGNIMR